MTARGPARAPAPATLATGPLSSVVSSASASAGTGGTPGAPVQPAPSTKTTGSTASPSSPPSPPHSNYPYRPARPSRRQQALHVLSVIPDCEPSADDKPDRRAGYSTISVGIKGDAWITVDLSLLDLGASRSISSLRAIQRAFPTRSVTWNTLAGISKEPVEELAVKGITGVARARFVTVPLRIGSQPLKHVSVGIVDQDDLPWDFIVGHDLIRAFNIIPDTTRQIAQINGNEEIPCPTGYYNYPAPAHLRPDEPGVYLAYAAMDQIFSGISGGQLAITVPGWVQAGADVSKTGDLLQLTDGLVQLNGALVIPNQTHSARAVFYANVLLPATDAVVVVKEGAPIGYIDARKDRVIHDNQRALDLSRELGSIPGGHAFIGALTPADSKWLDADGEYDYRLDQPSEEDLGKIKLDHVPEEYRPRLRQILRDYVLAGTSTKPGISKVPPMAHKFKDPHQQPTDTKQYPAPLAKQQIIESLAHGMRDAGIVRPSRSAWNSPVLLVKKPDGSWRFCVDLRKVNAVLERDGYQPARLENILEALRDAKVFTTLDLCAGFHQLPLAEETKPLTAFTTLSGKWEFNVATMGLLISPAHMQRALDEILRGLHWRCCVTFVDDTCVYSADWDQHLKDLEAVLARFREHGLHLRLDKCKFGCESVRYLGHVISSKGVHTDPAVIKDVRDARPPTTLRDLQRVLGLFGYYRRFIKNYAGIAAPLTRYLRTDNLNPTAKNAPRLQLDAAALDAFDQLKEAICSAPVLRLFDPSRPLIITSDGGEWFASHVISQKYDDGEHPVAFWSKAFTDTQHTYSSHAREMLSLVWAIQERHEWINITGHFIARFDHASLQWLKSKVHEKLMYNRWLMTIAEFQIDFDPIPREKNRVADALGKAAAFTPLPTTPHRKGDADAAPDTSLQTRSPRSSSCPSASSARTPYTKTYRGQQGLLATSSPLVLPATARSTAGGRCKNRPQNSATFSTISRTAPSHRT